MLLIIIQVRDISKIVFYLVKLHHRNPEEIYLLFLDKDLQNCHAICTNNPRNSFRMLEIFNLIKIWFQIIIIWFIKNKKIRFQIREKKSLSNNRNITTIVYLIRKFKGNLRVDLKLLMELVLGLIMFKKLIKMLIENLLTIIPITRPKLEKVKYVSKATIYQLLKSQIKKMWVLVLIKLSFLHSKGPRVHNLKEYHVLVPNRADLIVIFIHKMHLQAHKAILRKLFSNLKEIKLQKRSGLIVVQINLINFFI